MPAHRAGYSYANAIRECRAYTRTYTYVSAENRTGAEGKKNTRARERQRHCLRACEHRREFHEDEWDGAAMYRRKRAWAFRGSCREVGMRLYSRNVTSTIRLPERARPPDARRSAYGDLRGTFVGTRLLLATVACEFAFLARDEDGDVVLAVNTGMAAGQDKRDGGRAFDGEYAIARRDVRIRRSRTRRARKTAESVFGTAPEESRKVEADRETGRTERPRGAVRRGRGATRTNVRDGRGDEREGDGGDGER